LELKLEMMTLKNKRTIARKVRDLCIAALMKARYYIYLVIKLDTLIRKILDFSIKLEIVRMYQVNLKIKTYLGWDILTIFVCMAEL